MENRNFPVAKNLICILNKNFAILDEKYDKNLQLCGIYRNNIYVFYCH